VAAPHLLGGTAALQAAAEELSSLPKLVVERISALQSAIFRVPSFIPIRGRTYLGETLRAGAPLVAESWNACERHEPIELTPIDAVTIARVASRPLRSRNLDLPAVGDEARACNERATSVTVVRCTPASDQNLCDIEHVRDAILDHEQPSRQSCFAKVCCVAGRYTRSAPAGIDVPAARRVAPAALHSHERPLNADP